MKRAKTVIEVPSGMELPLKVRMEGSDFPFWQWLEVPPGRELVVICAADSVVTYLCHYLNGNYVPCGHNWGLECAQHKDGASLRTVFQGSLPVTRANGGRVFLWNPTAACLRSGTPALEARTDLLGRKLVIGRRLGGRNAKMYWADTKVLRPEWAGKGYTPGEIWRTQLNVWGVEVRAVNNLRGALEKMCQEQGSPLGVEALHGEQAPGTEV